MIHLLKNLMCFLFLWLCPTLHGMSSSHELIFYEDQNLPIRDAIKRIAKASGKRVLFGSDIKGTSSFSIIGVPWRKVLDSFSKVHNLSINELNHEIYVQNNRSMEIPNLFSETKQVNSVERVIDPISESNNSKKKAINNELEIKGVSGSHNNLKAIVDYKGRNQTWSVGNIIDEKYRVLKIEEDGLTLLDLDKNNELIVKFY